MRLVAIKKGKRLGTTLLAHSFKPDFAAVRLLLEKVTSPITNKTNVAGRIYFFIAKTAKNNLGSYIAIGIAGIFLFHMAENIGMTMGLLPITGVPLPFVSYGGSSLLTNLMMIGLLLNISGRRQKAIFID